MIENSKKYDLEERTLKYANDVIDFVNVIPNTIPNIEIVKQLIRSGCSVGSNYIEANGSLGKKDFVMRIRICKKEARESIFWLNLIRVKEELAENKRQSLIKETDELTRIFGSILEKTKV